MGATALVVDGIVLVAKVLLWAGLLLAVPLFLWATVRGLRLARRHVDVAPAGRIKVLAGAVLGLVLMLGGLVTLGAVPTPDGHLHEFSDQGFVATTRASLYNALDVRLQGTVGEKAYQDQLSTVKAKDTQIGILEGKIPENKQLLSAAQALPLQNTTQANRDAVAAAESEQALLRTRLATFQASMDEAATQLARLDVERTENLTLAFGTDTAARDAALAADGKVVTLSDTIAGDAIALSEAEGARAKAQSAYDANRTAHDGSDDHQIAVLRLHQALLDAQASYNKTFTTLQKHEAQRSAALKTLHDRLDPVGGAAADNARTLLAQSVAARAEAQKAIVAQAETQRQIAPVNAQVDALWNAILKDEPATTKAAVSKLRAAQTDVPALLAQARKERLDALGRLHGDKFHAPPYEALELNHAFYLRLKPLIQAQDVEGVQALMEDAHTDQRSTLPGDLYVTMPDFHEGSAISFARLARDVPDFEMVTLWFVFPSLVGLLFAPLVFGIGNVVRKAWVPSDSVGYKPYPYVSGGLFLLLGGFGIPAFYFAAWTLRDLERRSVEGQIAL